MAIRISLDEMANATSAGITNTQILASYNWSSSALKNLLVPGFPPWLQTATVPYTLGKDSAEQLADETFRRTPEYPLEPLFRALDVCSPDFPLKDVQVFTNRSNLRRLLDFLSNGDDGFQFYVEKVEHCIVLTGKPSVENFQRPGYGHNFEKRNTLIEPRASGFSCVFYHNLGDLKLIVTAEIDGVKPKSTGNRRQPPQEVRWESKKGSSLLHASVGELIQYDSCDIYEMKTISRQSSANFRWKQLYMQMVLGGANRLLRGLHHWGNFFQTEDIGAEDIQTKVPEANRRLDELRILLKLILARLGQNSNHEVYLLEYKPTTKQLVLQQLEKSSSRLPEWVLNKLQN